MSEPLPDTRQRPSEVRTHEFGLLQFIPLPLNCTGWDRAFEFLLDKIDLVNLTVFFDKVGCEKIRLYSARCETRCEGSVLYGADPHWSSTIWRWSFTAFSSTGSQGTALPTHPSFWAALPFCQLLYGTSSQLTHLFPGSEAEVVECIDCFWQGCPSGSVLLFWVFTSAYTWSSPRILLWLLGYWGLSMISSYSAGFVI